MDPQGEPHTGFVDAQSSYYCTFIDVPTTEPHLEQTTPVAMPPVLRELLLHLRSAEPTDDERARLEASAITLIKPVKSVGPPLPMPRDPRARDVAAAIAEDPSDPRPTQAQGAAVGVSARTLDRIFADETGLTFTQWRIQARVRTAMLLLANGQRVGEVAHHVGYRTPSAFVRIFRQTTGCTPRAYQLDAAGIDVTTTGLPMYDVIKP